MTGFMRLGCVLPITLALTLSSCIPIPIPSLGYTSDSRTNLPDRVPVSIVIGKTTREEVLLGLGTPDSFAPDLSWMTYQSARHKGGVAFLIGGGYSAGVVGPVSSYETRLLVIRFDANSIVIDAALEDRTHLGASGYAPSTAPDLSEESTTELSALRTFYVAAAEADVRDINLLIVAELRRKGLRATTGPANVKPSDVDAILTYRPACKSDATAGLASLTVSVRTPDSDAALATAGSDQTPRAPKTSTDMVAEAVAGLFGDSTNTFLTFSPDELTVKSPVAAPQGQGTVHIEPVRDARSMARGKVIGERTSLGVSLGEIDVSPRPAAIIRDLLAAELEKLGYRNVPAGAKFDIETHLSRFTVETPSTALYWDINGVIAIDIAVKRNSERQRLHFEVTCTDRTYRWLSQPLVKGVVSACLASLGTRIREDRALAQLLAAD